MKKIKRVQFIFVFLCLLSALLAKSQVGIGTTTPDASSVLDVYANDKGFLLPRLTTIQRDAIALPAIGLLIYNSTTLRFNYFDTVWKDFLADMVLPNRGGTGVANDNASTVTLTGAFPIGITTTAPTTVTLPVIGTLYGTETGSIPSTQFSNSLSDETGTGNLVLSNSPIFTGIPLAPTAPAGTNTTQLATTAFVMDNTDRYHSITDNAMVTTTSATDVVLTGMTITPPAGTYLVMFNSQYTLNAINSSANGPTVNTVQCLADLQTAYNQLMSTTTTNATHTPAFGGGETLTPGVYAIGAAASIGGTLILDGQGDSNAVFIFKINGAFSTGADSTVVLTNGAAACNVFWVAEGAISIGASCIMKGTFIANAGACFMGASGELEGRLFSITGAINFGPGLLYIPLNCTYLTLGLLSTFVAFTGTGAVGNTSNSTITGNVGTNNGAITGFEGSIINGTISNPSGSITFSTNDALATFSIYQNGVLIANSSRTKTNAVPSGDVSLQAIAIVLDGEAIDVRWKIDDGMLNVTNRIVTLISIR